MMKYEAIELIDMFLDERDVTAISKRQYLFNLKRFFKWVLAEGLSWETLRKSDMLRYKESLVTEGKTSLTVAGYMGTLRLFYRWLERNALGDDLTTSIRIVNGYKTFRKKSLSVEQAKQFLKGFERKTVGQLRDYAIANLMLRNGLREIEVVRMNVEDIVEHQGQRAIRIQRKGKTGKDAMIPLSEKAMEAIEAYLLVRPGNWQEGDALFVSVSRSNLGQRLTTHYLSVMIKSMMKICGMDERQITAHSLRHTTATLLIGEGFSEYDVQMLMGHSSFAITQIYTRQKEMDMIFKRNPVNHMDKAI